MHIFICTLSLRDISFQPSRSLMRLSQNRLAAQSYISKQKRFDESCAASYTWKKRNIACYFRRCPNCFSSPLELVSNEDINLSFILILLVQGIFSEVGGGLVAIFINVIFIRIVECWNQEFGFLRKSKWTTCFANDMNYLIGIIFKLTFKSNCTFQFIYLYWISIRVIVHYLFVPHHTKNNMHTSVVSWKCEIK